MCKIWDDIRNDGKQEGIIQGRQEGIIEGKKEGIVEGKKVGKLEATVYLLKQFMTNLNKGLEEAMIVLGIPSEEKEMYREMIVNL